MGIDDLKIGQPSQTQAEEDDPVGQILNDHNAKIQQHALREKQELLFANYAHGVLQWTLWLKNHLDNPELKPQLRFTSRRDAFDSMLEMIDSVQE